uniref:7TM GPCR serpentine receptor class x (Srx) domain-containing protein n=1 Tax=Panagrolaimus davidi TaxID=227884 RepID=A0A914PYP9_9BILA
MHSPVSYNSACNPELEKSNFTAFMGYYQTAWHTLSVYIQVVKSSNRCFAIMFPARYRTAFTCKNTIIFLGISSFFCFSHVTLFIYYGCYYFYSNQFYAWSFYKPECDESPGAVINLFTQIALVSFTLCLDCLILGLLWKRRTQNTRSKHGNREKRFFFQTCLTSLFHAGMLIPPRLLKPLTTNQFLIFLTGTPSMMTFHAMNEFLFVAFTLNTIRKKNDSHVTAISKTTHTPMNTSTITPA